MSFLRCFCERKAPNEKTTLVQPSVCDVVSAIESFLGVFLSSLPKRGVWNKYKFCKNRRSDGEIFLESVNEFVLTISIFICLLKSQSV